MWSQESILVFRIFAILAIVLLIVGPLWYKRRREKRAEDWPTTEATIESGMFQTVPSGGRTEPLKAPVLFFSYHVGGEYLSGRVALMEFFDDEGEEIIRRMIMQKLEIHYDPQDSTRWYIDDRIAGCRIQQEGLWSETHRHF